MRTVWSSAALVETRLSKAHHIVHIRLDSDMFAQDNDTVPDAKVDGKNLRCENGEVTSDRRKQRTYELKMKSSVVLQDINKWRGRTYVSMLTQPMQTTPPPWGRT